ncbi:MAG: hypothetical protein JXL84_22550 [Deltaproteobacteria bacterium]|nr:hypothetical protein [Deltaproteobacteria bacterium]
MIDFCKRRLAGFKTPKSVEFVKNIPKNPTGKIMKKEIRNRYWAGADRNI